MLLLCANMNPGSLLERYKTYPGFGDIDVLFIQTKANEYDHTTVEHTWVMSCVFT